MTVAMVMAAMLVGAAFGWRFGRDMHHRSPRALWPLGIAYILILVATFAVAVPNGWLGAVALGAGWIVGLAIAEDAEIRKRERVEVEEELRSIAAEGGIVDNDGNPIDPASVRLMTPRQERESGCRRRSRRG